MVSERLQGRSFSSVAVKSATNETVRLQEESRTRTVAITEKGNRKRDQKWDNKLLKLREELSLRNQNGFGDGAGFHPAAVVQPSRGTAVQATTFRILSIWRQIKGKLQLFQSWTESFQLFWPGRADHRELRMKAEIKLPPQPIEIEWLLWYNHIHAVWTRNDFLD